MNLRNVCIYGCIIAIGLAGYIAIIFRPRIEGVYKNPTMACGCGYPQLLLFHDGLIIEIYEGHNSYKLWGKYTIKNGFAIAEPYRASGTKVPNCESECIPRYFGMRVRNSSGRNGAQFIWRIPKVDIENYISDKSFEIYEKDQSTGKSVKSMVSYQQWLARVKAYK